LYKIQLAVLNVFYLTLKTGGIMPNYYVNRNAQEGGEHEVHRDGCPTPANSENRLYLGNFTSCNAAVVEARKHYDNVDGCKNCSLECHTR
jgi:hypothetical protein